MIALLTTAMAASASFADDRPRRDAPQRGVSEQRAIAIARGYGMVEVIEVDRDDNGWEIEGRDHRGRDLEVDINNEGRVTRVERGDDD